MRKTIAFTRELLMAPSKALKRIQGPDAALKESAYLYLIVLVAGIIYYTLKPENFPPVDETTKYVRSFDEPHNLFFWIKVHSLEPLLTLLEVLALGWFSWFLKSSLRIFQGPVKFITSCVLGLVPLIPMFLYKYDAISKPVFALLWLVILAAMIPGLRSRKFKSWKALLSISMALNAVGLALLVPFTLAILFQSAMFYSAMEILMPVWMIGLGTYLLSGVEEIPLARAWLALVLAVVLFPAQFIFSAYLLGLLPREILKAMMIV